MSESWHINFYRRELAPTPSTVVTPRILTNARIGKSYWGVTTSRIPSKAPHRSVVEGIVKELHNDERVGRGALFHGPFGSGKTSCGVVCLKSGIVRGGQASMLSALEMRAAYDRRIYYLTPEGIQLWDMACRCQLLLLDDLGSEIGPTVGGGDTRVAEELIRARYNDQLTTYITTNLSLDQLSGTYRGIASIPMDWSRYYKIEVTGIDWRAS